MLHLKKRTIFRAVQSAQSLGGRWATCIFSSRWILWWLFWLLDGLKSRSLKNSVFWVSYIGFGHIDTAFTVSLDDSDSDECLEDKPRLVDVKVRWLIQNNRGFIWWKGWSPCKTCLDFGMLLENRAMSDQNPEERTVIYSSTLKGHSVSNNTEMTSIERMSRLPGIHITLVKNRHQSYIPLAVDNLSDSGIRAIFPARGRAGVFGNLAFCLPSMQVGLLLRFDARPLFSTWFIQTKICWVFKTVTRNRVHFWVSNIENISGVIVFGGCDPYIISLR